MMSVLLQPPPTAEELALKEQVTQVLASQGVLAKLKAELRAAVFEVMHEREGFAKRNDPTAPKLSDFPIETRTTALSLIVECLQFFHWKHALGVLLAETDAVDEQRDSARLAMKLRLPKSSSSKTPTLFQLIESRIIGGDHVADSANVRSVPTRKNDQFDGEDDEEDTPVVDMPVPTRKNEQFDGEDDEEEAPAVNKSVPSRKQEQFDDEEESLAVNKSVPKTKPWEREEVVNPLPSTSNEFKRTETEADDDNKGENSEEIEESMAEEVPSGSELEESNFTNYDDEESHNHSSTECKQPTVPSQLQEERQNDEKHQYESESDDVKLAAPPPAPAKMPALPPLVSTPNNIVVEDAEDDFDADEEAERLRNLDAALQAMEAEDDTGTLQQLKASLQVELQEQDSFVSSGGLGRADDDEDNEAETSKARDTEEEEVGYGSSDFEEEEEIASEISEEMESVSDLSDKEGESVEGAAVSAAEAEPPHALRNDKRVDSEDALNSYDYIEDVEKGRW